MAEIKHALDLWNQLIRDPWTAKSNARMHRDSDRSYQGNNIILEYDRETPVRCLFVLRPNLAYRNESVAHHKMELFEPASIRFRNSVDLNYSPLEVAKSMEALKLDTEKSTLTDIHGGQSLLLLIEARLGLEFRTKEKSRPDPSDAELYLLYLLLESGSSNANFALS